MAISPPPRSVGWQPQPAVAGRSIGRRTPEQFEAEWRGERIIDRIAFWSAFGFVGQIIMDRLADKLDECSAWLEQHAFLKPSQEEPQRIIYPSPASAIQIEWGTDRPQPHISAEGVTTMGNRVLHGGFAAVPAAPEKVWGKSGVWTEADILKELALKELAPRRWYCARCDSFFADEWQVRNHVCHG